MSLRPTQTSIFNQVRSGISFNLNKLAIAQRGVATGKRILAPSDDAIGTSVSLSVRRQMGGVDAYLGAITTVRPLLATGASQLQEASGMLTEARAQIMAGMNGTLSDEDRATLAGQLELLYESLLEVGNSRSGERYLFAGTATSTQPFQETIDNGRRVVQYRGDGNEQSILIGRGVLIELNVPGDEAFGKFEFSGVSFGGLTGLSLGTSANSGSGYQDVTVRHDATLGALGAGLALANGGADDTIMGDHTLVVDSAARSARLGSGPPVAISTPPPAALEIKDGDGSVVVIDFSAWTGGSDTTTLTGQGSIALNDGAFQAITLTETDLELVDDARGIVLHVDTSGVTRAAQELATYRGAANLFNTILGAAEDLRNTSSLTRPEVFERLQERLSEFDRGHNSVLMAMGKLGSRTQRLDSTDNRLQDLRVHLDSLVSSVEDADLTEMVLDLNQAEQTLQVAQATGARLLQQTLLNFLR